MLHDDIIQLSKSPWASTVVLVKKKNRTLRFSADCRCLNKITKKDVNPLPWIGYTIDGIHSTKYFRRWTSKLFIGKSKSTR